MTRIDVRQAAGGGGGGGASTPPGQAAHYIGTWDVAVAYAAGDCVRAWDAGNNGWALFQAKAATTGDAPDVTQSTAAWAWLPQDGAPIIMWGTEDPNSTGSDDPNGGGVAAPLASTYLWRNPTDDLQTSLLFMDETDSGRFNYVLGQVTNGGWSAYRFNQVSSVSGMVDASTLVQSEGTGNGDALAKINANKFGSGSGQVDVSIRALRAQGTGDAIATVKADRTSSGAGDADARASASVQGTTVGTAYAGVTAIHHAGGEAHVIPTANATHAFNDIKADLIFTDNTEGPVIHDQSDGHTYRIVSTAGVLSTVQVT